MKLIFPDPRKTDETGLLCIGGDLKVETLKSAYSKGIFPWPQENYPLLWFSPLERGVLDFSRLHVPRSLDRFLKKNSYRITFNQAFEQVIRCCQKAPRPGQNGTWILPEMVEAYCDFHRAGYAHSVECWDGDELVGGLYGVWIHNVFSGESMFYKRDNASKLCVLAMVERIQQTGQTWMDTQMVTPVLEGLGGHYISRDEFLSRLTQAHATPEVVL